MLCDINVHPSQITSHHLKKHGSSIPDIDHRQLQSILEYFGIRGDLPPITEGNHPEIEGLHVLDGFFCSICKASFPEDGAVNRHAAKAHPSQVHHLSPPQNCCTLVQRLKQGRGLLYFSVIPKQDLPEPGSVEAILDALAPYIPTSNPTLVKSSDLRNICPWLCEVRWQDFTIDKSVSELRVLAVHLTEPELAWLTLIVSEAVRYACTLFDLTPELILQKIHFSQSTE